MMLTSILIPFSFEYYKEFVANTSASDWTWNLSTFRGECLIHLEACGDISHNNRWWYL